ncbi:MAG: TraB/GumN family protein [Oceanicaulis sp.]|uniref:TraB/GumN family protein n=1 Tax=unclassified Oceanicaulis TaxID=2632123 RepID=UPI000C44FF34|nr:MULTISPECIES: TraB/GumN family protein [unclassified Oceanicaulis]MAB69160.1 TraB/GumN family protein [Oceanicaulis sp.]MBC38817.1 TraB/GumN family protein [Oceanicaulis sp.]MBG36215.1 TraB/GumN family protein [Oceanicaulis sp.]HBU63311.1 TraB/GumN family protein [Oceanicaulis sp.]HCR94282.1 TraB/GumN family protein [Oceanicaulis sp.]|tara:strand:+ start:2147 stop:3046 length:900 start_codon:yes stop_codon:yes gene_type:complete
MFKPILGALAGLMLAVSPAVAQSEAEAPAIWAMSDEDSTVYLLGTVHILHPDLDWRTPYLDTVLEEVEQVWFEADTLSPEANAQMTTLIPQLGLNTTDTPMTQRLSDEANADLATFAGRLGANPDQLRAALDPYQPWIATIQLAVLQMQAAGYDPASGVEVVLNQRLADQDKTFHYLETVEEQLRFFADMPYETQLANLELSLHEAVENPDMFDDLVGAWAEGDMDRLNEIMNSDMREQTPELYDVILVQRNRNWAPEIAAALDGDEDVLIAVGAGHMPGEEGVIALLQARGLEVRRVQ